MEEQGGANCLDGNMNGPLVIRINPIFSSVLTIFGGTEQHQRDHHDGSSDEDLVAARSPPPKRRRTRETAATALPEATQQQIQELLERATSLGDITRVTLAFFKEHESLQRRAADRAVSFPISIPASALYCLLVPRKRRVYDVLHVLEGIGVVQRVRSSSSSSQVFRGVCFLYNGMAGTIQHLESMRDKCREIVRSWTESAATHSWTTLDTAIVQACIAQGGDANWPQLVTTTVAFLSLLLQDTDYASGSLQEINRRFIAAKGESGGCSTAESNCTEINRRVYDVVSVLATCNIVVFRKSIADSSSGQRDHYATNSTTGRKEIRFNHALFASPSLLRVGDICSFHLARQLSGKTCKSQAKQKRRRASVPDRVMIATESDSGVPLQDLFPSIDFAIPEPPEFGDWWNDSLRDLVFRDALPRADFLDWEIMKALSRDQEESHELPLNESIASRRETSGSRSQTTLECDETLEFC